MAWPLHPSELNAPSTATLIDWNNARKFNAVWEDEALTTSAIAVAGDGKYRVTYSGAQNLDDITGTAEGDVVCIRADVTGAGATLTIRNNGGGSGNIRCNAGVDIALTSDLEWAIFTHIGTTLTGGMIYGVP